MISHRERGFLRESRAKTHSEAIFLPLKAPISAGFLLHNNNNNNNELPAYTGPPTGRTFGSQRRKGGHRDAPACDMCRRPRERSGVRTRHGARQWSCNVACRSFYTHPPPTYTPHYPYSCHLPRRVAPSLSPTRRYPWRYPWRPVWRPREERWPPLPPLALRDIIAPEV